jgi:hypothetical protein
MLQAGKQWQKLRAVCACASFAALGLSAGLAHAGDATWQIAPLRNQSPRLSLSLEPQSQWENPRDRQAFDADYALPPARRAEKIIDAQALMLRIAPSDADAAKGRFFVYAAGSGRAFGLNLMRDPQDGWRRAGWSVERLAEVGKAQLGVGWRSGDAQISLSATRRAIGIQGFSRDDQMVGLNLSLKPSR